ncbi:hypothetical protein THF5G08_90045 [Vibrio jasicida]|nr:hypothetical protein THF5G08_90045 [Vibrio jasicida]
MSHKAPPDVCFIAFELYHFRDARNGGYSVQYLSFSLMI